MRDADLARGVFREAAALFGTMAAERADETVRAADVIRTALEGGRKVLVFGNGGSATDAEHLAAELVGRFRKQRPGLAAIALTADSAVVTSIGNDFGFDEVFRRQVEALGQPGDVAVALTTSGASPNVNLALAAARERGLVTVGLTGRDGGATGPLVDVHVNVPSADTARVQEVHRAVLHVLCELVERDRA
ncbi:MAG TPA: D-sedoheptulose 7-phosphate isomerase [Vicinamibacterales bacterium]|nr:D-sedoheptulose 7-phosphate isomerase [Vicinamibacterales bacterium]